MMAAADKASAVMSVLMAASISPVDAASQLAAPKINQQRALAPLNWRSED
jgi:hypothetical protein